MKSLKYFLVFSLCLFISIFTISPVLASSNATTAEEEENSKEQNKVDIPVVNAPETDKVIVESDIETPASVTGQKMEGNGTVVDFTTSGSRAFYTIVDNDQQVFYLVIDMDKTENNVYFLSDINKSELEGVPAGGNVSPVPTPEQDLESAKLEEPKESGNGFLIIVLLVAAVGVAAYYFLVMKKKQGQGKDEDEDEDEEMMDDNYEDDMLVREVSDQEKGR